MKNNLKEKWDKECEEAMKPNQIEKEILEKFDKKFNNIDVNECEYNDDGEPDNMVIIDSEGLRRNGLKSVRQFISDSLSTYRTQVEKATLQAIKDKMPKEKQIKCNNTHIIAGDKPIKVCYNCASDGGFNYCRSQMLEIIEKLNK